MTNDYKILNYEDFDTREARKLKADVAEAERGYTDKQLDAASKRAAGRPLSVGSTPATTIIKVRLDDSREAKLDDYAKRNHLSRSAAVRHLLDKALIDA